jgi:hypothetical protein
MIVSFRKISLRYESVENLPIYGPNIRVFRLDIVVREIRNIVGDKFQMIRIELGCILCAKVLGNASDGRESIVLLRVSACM